MNIFNKASKRYFSDKVDHFFLLFRFISNLEGERTQPTYRIDLTAKQKIIWNKFYRIPISVLNIMRGNKLWREKKSLKYSIKFNAILTLCWEMKQRKRQKKNLISQIRFNKNLWILKQKLHVNRKQNQISVTKVICSFSRFLFVSFFILLLTITKKYRKKSLNN